ncbi:hypothetical protein [Halovenus salina]|uniref:DUF8108 domain-containing protein n=1 Tax=Halovenus salina TaxID=1510225 RepID=A0ABD5W0E0_9EURY|nr:hypothetical protein [Halovenus salina]
MADVNESSQQEEKSTNSPGPNEQYCISCGDTISSKADVCPHCGAPQDESSSGRQNSASQDNTNLSPEGERQFKQAIDDKKVEGWDVKSRQGDRVVLVKRGFGSLGSHVLVALLTAWWTVFIGNVVYAAYKYFIDTDKMVIRKSEYQ